MTRRIERAMDIFLDALNTNNLIPGDCTKCAVGNLVRVGMGYGEEYKLPESESEPFVFGYIKDDPFSKYFLNWSVLFATSFKDQDLRNKEEQKELLKKYPILKQQIDSTGFTIDELSQIEYAFETNAGHDRAGQIKGLEAVVQVMMGFDDSKENVKEVFTDKAELIPCLI